MNSPDSGTENRIDLARIEKMSRVNRQTINRLKERVGILENALELVCGDPQMQWLYRNRDERMDATVPLFPESRVRFHLARYEFAAEHVSGLVVADIACGTGYGSQLLSEQGDAAAVIGIDRCPQTIEYACERHAGDRVRFQVGDACSTGIADRMLDSVVSFETIEHVADAEALIEEFYRILKPGGILICSTPNAWPLEIAAHHVREFDRRSFEKLLQIRFSMESLFNQNSGSDFRYNHDQPAGMVATTDANQELAECFVAICRK